MTHSKDSDAVRSEFEQWADSQGLRLAVRDRAPKDSTRFGQYCEDNTQLAFEAWREAWRSALSARAGDSPPDTDALLRDAMAVVNVVASGVISIVNMRAAQALLPRYAELTDSHATDKENGNG